MENDRTSLDIRGQWTVRSEIVRFAFVSPVPTETAVVSRAIAVRTTRAEKREKINRRKRTKNNVKYKRRRFRAGWRRRFCSAAARRRTVYKRKHTARGDRVFAAARA